MPRPFPSLQHDLPGTRDLRRWARVVCVALGVWLFLSSFAWPHSDAQFTNSWMMGVLTVAFSAMGFEAPPVRFLNTTLAVWLFASAFILPAGAVATIWNNALVAVALFFLSLVGGEEEGFLPRRPSMPV